VFVRKRLAILGFSALTASLPALGQDKAAGEPSTWAYLKTPLPGAPASCPDAKPAGEGLVKVSLFDGRSASCPVATVENESVTLQELAGVIAEAHESREGAARQAGQVDARAILDRLVDVRLIVLEANAMGIDELPEMKKAVEAVKERVGRTMLQEQVMRDVKPVPADVERFFKDAVREYKLQSVLFARESDAKAMMSQLKAGKSFDALATAAVADKKAKGNDPGQFVHPSQLIPAVAGAIAGTPAGKATGPVKVPGGYAVVEVEDLRYPESAKARGEAEQRSLADQRRRALEKYYKGLLARYAKVDEKLLKKIDFEAKKPGFEAMKKDRRVLATVQGHAPITVGDLAEKLATQYFHGTDEAVKKKKLNKAKAETLDSMVAPLVVADEVARLEIPKSTEFRQRVDADVDALLFETFVKKVVLPGVKLEEAQVRAYYDTHKGDYASAAFYKIETIGFATQKDAEAAAQKLRAGTDFKWLNANADGKLADGKDTDRPPAVISAKGMSPAFARAMDGAKKGDYRVYAAPNNQFYTVSVVDLVPPSQQPYEEVKEAIVEKLYGQAVQASIQDWIAKLRKAHPVQVHLARIGT
jgi:parvulin-like peptidyl-prolyl isomerase